MSGGVLCRQICTVLEALVAFIQRGFITKPLLLHSRPNDHTDPCGTKNNKLLIVFKEICRLTTKMKYFSSHICLFNLTNKIDMN